MHLTSSDVIGSTHRGHGHCIAKGVDVVGMMAEMYGKSTGSCAGKGGSMHIADLDHGMLGANGIVGGGPPLICGAALAAKYKQDQRCGSGLLRRRRVNRGVAREFSARFIPSGDIQLNAALKSYSEPVGRAAQSKGRDSRSRAHSKTAYVSLRRFGQLRGISIFSPRSRKAWNPERVGRVEPSASTD